MALATIVWVDDEIDSLRSQQLFLEQKGYQIVTFSNGYDALEYLKENISDVVFLDESMPGMNGLDALQQIKELHPALPAVMITKNETEVLMEDAIGRQIDDYLIKPVNPNQVLLSLKKILDNKRLVAEKTTSAYQQEFRNLFMALNDKLDYNQWGDLYKKLVYWELEMEKSQSSEMSEIFQSQKSEADKEFVKYASKNYEDWVWAKPGEGPVMSHTLMRRKVLPKLDKEMPTFFVVLDNLRYDHWKILQPYFWEYFKIEEEDCFYSILPTATQYSRNAIFAGMVPSEIQKRFPDKWLNDDEQGSKNGFEEFFLQQQLKREFRHDIKMRYVKIANFNDGQDFYNHVQDYLANDLSVIVYNFVDMVSHARTEMEFLKEMAGDEVGFRNTIKAWFEHSVLFQAFKKLEGKKYRLVLATDHGSVRVMNPKKVVGDKQTTSNLRYKLGRNLNYNAKEVLAFRNPLDIGLPSPNVNSSYVFAREDDFLCYPQNYNYYASYYKNTFQHGGLSLEEMIIPVISMTSK